jgi:hypothetical protein
MTPRPLGLFDQAPRYRKLESLGDPLVILGKIVPWAIFREPLESARGPPRDEKKGGRPFHDAVLMFKILVLRELYSLSDEPVEFQIADRLSFQRFLGIGIESAVPDHSTVWRFRETLKDGVRETLFERLGVYIDLAGFEAKKGPMLDASLVEKVKTRQPPEGEAVYADSAYRSAATKRYCEEHGLKDRTMAKAHRNRPLWSERYSSTFMRHS